MYFTHPCIYLFRRFNGPTSPPIVHSIYPSTDPSFSSPPIISPHRSIRFLALWIATHPTISFIHTPLNPNPSLRIFRAFNIKKGKRVDGCSETGGKHGGRSRKRSKSGRRSRGREPRKETRRNKKGCQEGRREFLPRARLAIILIAFLNGTVRCSATRAATRLSPLRSHLPSSLAPPPELGLTLTLPQPRSSFFSGTWTPRDIVSSLFYYFCPA